MDLKTLFSPLCDGAGASMAPAWAKHTFKYRILNLKGPWDMRRSPSVKPYCMSLGSYSHYLQTSNGKISIGLGWTFTVNCVFFFILYTDLGVMHTICATWQTFVKLLSRLCDLNNFATCTDEQIFFFQNNTLKCSDNTFA